MSSVSIRKFAEREVSPERRHGARGHAVIETALMAPWIFLLFIGIFDLGFYAYAGIVTANAARVAALSTSNSVASAADSTTACAYALEEMRSLPNVGNSTTTCGTVVTAAAVAVVEADTSTTSQVTISYQTIPLIPIPGLTGRMTITRVAQMRCRAN